MTKIRYCLERLDTVEYEHLYKFKDAALKELNALEAENEALKCCGNCSRWHSSGILKYCVLGDMPLSGAAQSCDKWVFNKSGDSSPLARGKHD